MAEAHYDLPALQAALLLAYEVDGEGVLRVRQQLQTTPDAKLPYQDYDFTFTLTPVRQF